MKVINFFIFLFFYSSAGQAASWVYDAFFYDPPTTGNQVVSLYDGNISSSLGKSFDGYQANCSTCAVAGCGGGLNWCSITVHSLAVSYDGGAVQLKGTRPLGPSSSGSCYLTGAVAILGQSATSGNQSLGTMPSEATPSGFLNYAYQVADGISEWVKINRSCSEITPDSIDMPNTIPVPSSHGYILTGNSRVKTQYIQFTQVMATYATLYTATDVGTLLTSTTVFACPTPLVNNQCGKSSYVYSTPKPAPPPPTSHCDITMPTEINFEALDRKKYIGARAEGNIDISCTDTSSIKFLFSNDATVGPFDLKVTINNEVNPIVNVMKQSQIKLSAQVVSANNDVVPGEYSATIVIVTSVM